MSVCLINQEVASSIPGTYNLDIFYGMDKAHSSLMKNTP